MFWVATTPFDHLPSQEEEEEKLETVKVVVLWMAGTIDEKRLMPFDDNS